MNILYQVTEIHPYWFIINRNKDQEKFYEKDNEFKNTFFTSKWTK